MRAGTIALPLLIALAACTRQAPAPAAPQATADRAGSVRITGDDALAAVLSWSLPAVDVPPAGAPAAGRRAPAAPGAGG